MIVLPWPDKRLSPNARQHWAQLAKVKAEARQEAHWLAKSDMPLRDRQAVAEGEERIPMRVTFYPPDNRRRDDDNMVGGFKAYRDGIADALGVDDRRFRPHYFFEDAEKPGRIVVEFGGLSTPPDPSPDSSHVVEEERAGSLRQTASDPDHNHLTRR